MIENEATIRLTVFFGLIVILALAEALIPRRTQPARKRWLVNLSLVLTYTLLVRLLIPAGAAGAALYAADNDIGLFNNFASPDWLSALLALLLLDMAIYFQHRIFHKVPLFWRLHRLHHSDIDFDFTTAVRFHPLEIFVSMGIKIALILALGAPLVSVILFEIILSGAALFNHANLAIPRTLDRILRWFIVTPDMHRIHHSVRRQETDSNFGFSISLWDRIFGSYRSNPVDDHRTMPIGIEQFREPQEQRFGALLLQPFR